VQSYAPHFTLDPGNTPIGRLSKKKLGWTVWITGKRDEIQDGVQDGHHSIKSSITTQGNGVEK